LQSREKLVDYQKDEEAAGSYYSTDYQERDHDT
jgi:hypothetical protein